MESRTSPTTGLPQFDIKVVRNATNAIRELEESMRGMRMKSVEVKQFQEEVRRSLHDWADL